ncbi:MAG TPA: DUF1080 domain-containing protein [Steroidobacteraceae bacterium]|nr:DUF1080 domain-containing protein [Steroidobacteraceae bacterium]
MRKFLCLLLLCAPAFADDTAPWLGRWDVTLIAPDRDYPTWLEISAPGGQLQVRMVGRWGHARVLPSATLTGGVLRFISPKEEEGRKDDMVFEATLDGGKLVGGTHGPDGTAWKLRGERAPTLARRAPPVWGKPVELFNGRDLAGWHLSDPAAAATWRVENGLLVSLGNGAELVTDRKFDDFKLHLEFKVAPGANSGIYLRGRYEVQVEHDSHPEAAERSLGGVYGFLAPSPLPAHTPDIWRSYDITLIGRRVTIALDGVTIVKDQEIPGVTGGALDTHEGEPGPLYLQGSENGRVEFRHVNITPATAR